MTPEVTLGLRGSHSRSGGTLTYRNSMPLPWAECRGMAICCAIHGEWTRNVGMPYSSYMELNLHNWPATVLAEGSFSQYRIPWIVIRVASSRLVTTSYVTGSPTWPARPSHPHTCATTPSSTQVALCGAGRNFCPSQTHSKILQGQQLNRSRRATFWSKTYVHGGRFHSRHVIGKYVCGIVRS